MEKYQPNIEQSKKFCENIVSQFLQLPEKRNFENPDFELAQKLGVFLVKQGFIKNVDVLEGSWGFKYNSGNKIISINEIPMSVKNYEHYVFRLGKNTQTGEYLFPQYGEETDRYRFLHEVSHAYQNYLANKENHGQGDYWYAKVLLHEIDSIFAVLYEYCYLKRQKSDSGLSVFGNISDYNHISQPSQKMTRALEDANELITMFLWNPKYLETFLDYVSGNIEGYGEESLRSDGLVKISNEEKEALKKVIVAYIDEMKENVGL